MATHPLINPRLFKYRSSPLMVGGPEYPTIKETASQTYPIGALVYQDSNGTIALCTNSSDKLDSAIAGQALKAATGVTGGNVYFRAIRATDVYIMNIYHTTVASAVTAQTDIGVIYGIFYNTSATLTTGSNSKFVIDKVNTSVESSTVCLARVKVIGFPRTSPVDGSPNAVGDTYGFCFVQFQAYSAATDGAPSIHVLQYDV